MADIFLQKPKDGQTLSKTPQPEDRLVLEFNSTDATLTRDGDNLVMTFNEGTSEESNIELVDFYVAYTADNMPNFLIGGVEIDGQSFFEALDEDLMPAAGNTAPINSGNSVGLVDGSLLSGIDRETRLDQERDDNNDDDDDFEALGTNDGDDGDDTSNSLPEGNTVKPNTAPEILPPNPDDNNDPNASDTAITVKEMGEGANSAFGDAESGTPSMTGQIVAVDADGDSLTFEVTNAPDTSLGNFTINNQTGVYEFTLNDDATVDALKEGEERTETYTITVSDGRGGTVTQDVTVTIKGTNDAPDLSIKLDEGVDNIISEDSTDQSVSGTFDVVDPDSDGGVQTLTVNNVTVDKDASGKTVIEGQYGNIEVDANGNFTYTLGVTDAQKDAVNALNEGDKPTESFVITTTDAHGSTDTETLDIIVNGSNDKPTIDPDSVTNLTITELGEGENATSISPENTTVSMGGKLDIDDPDNDSFTITAEKQGDADSLGKFEVNNDGEYTFTLDNEKADSLNHGEIRTETYTITVSDGKGGTTTQDITVTITGTNDAPDLVIDAITSEVMEGTGETATGTISVDDPDTEDDTLAEQSITIEGQALDTTDPDSSIIIEGEYGNLEVKGDGSYTYTTGQTQDQIDALKALGDEKVEENFEVITKDNSNASDKGAITITVQGVNEGAPSINVEGATVKVTEVFLEGGSFTGTSHDISYQYTSGKGDVELNFGPDGMLNNSFEDAFAWDLDSAPDLKTSDDDQPVIWGYDGDDKTTLIGKDSEGNEVLRVEMDASGEFNVKLSQAVEHAAPDGGESADYNTDLEDKADSSADAADTPTGLEFGFTITDGNGDTASNSVNVQIEDDIILMDNVSEGKSTDEIHLESSETAQEPDFNYFNATADANDLKDALGDDLTATDSWNWGVYKGDFYENTADDKSAMQVGGENGFTIQGAIVTKGEYDYNTDGLALGWRDDRTDVDGDGQADYAPGIGLTSSNTSGSHYEVGNATGSYEDGAAVEALIIKLPDDELAYGVDLSFGCFFTSHAEGGDASDEEPEYITIEFYRDGVLITSVEQLAGVVGGDGSFDISNMTEPFDEIRIIPSENGSDFVLNGVDFSHYSNSIVASGSGEIVTTGADGIDGLVEFEGISIGDGDKVDVADGNSITLEDGTVLTLNQIGVGVFVAIADDGTAYFSMSLDGDGNWDVHQHEHFGDSINISFTATDNDGDSASHTVTIVGDDAPQAFDNTAALNEGDTTTGNVLTDGQDDLSGDDGFGADKVVDVKPAEGGDVEWTPIEVEGKDFAFESEYGIITFNKDGSYEFESHPGSFEANAKDPKDFDFEYTIQDADGDQDSATLTLTVDPQDGNVTMGEDSVTELNLCVVMDSSGSVGAAGMEELREALTELYEDLVTVDANADVNIALVDYSYGAGIVLNSVEELGDILNNPDHSLWNHGGGTNWEAALNSAESFFNNLDMSEGSTNMTIFMSDGNPSVHLENTVTATEPEFFTITIDGKEFTYVEGSKEAGHFSGSGEYGEHSGNPNSAVDYNYTYEAADGSTVTYYVDNGTSTPKSFFELNEDGTTSRVDSDSITISKPEIDITTGVKVAITPDVASSTDFTLVTVELDGVTYTFESIQEGLFDKNGDLGEIPAGGAYAKDSIVTFTDSQGNTIEYHQDMGAASKGSYFMINGEKVMANAEDAPDFYTTGGTHGLGEVWTENGVSYQLVESGGQYVLQYQDGDSWHKVGNVNFDDDANGSTASSQEVADAKIAADSLKEAMGEGGQLIGIGIGDGYEDKYFEEIGTDTLIGTDSDELGSVFAGVITDAQYGVFQDHIIDEVGGDAFDDDKSFTENVLNMDESNLQDVMDAADDAFDTYDFESESGDGNFTLSGEDDVFLGASSDETVSGGTGHDFIYGGGGDDTLFGEGGDDLLFGGLGNDTLHGGSGNDLLVGGSGKDSMFGGEGNDLIKMDFSDVLVDGGDGLDVVLLSENASMEDAKDMLTNGTIRDVEVLISGDVEGENTTEILQNSGAVDEDGNWVVQEENSGWTSEGTHQVGSTTFEQFTNEDDNVTILVETTKLENSGI